MGTMTRERKREAPRTFHLKPGDHFIVNGVSYMVPSAEIEQDIADFEEGRVELFRCDCVQDMIKALEAE